MSQLRNDLVAARDLLVRDGWTAGALVVDGQHCAVGAVLSVTGHLGTWGLLYGERVAAVRDPRVLGALKALAAQLPSQPFVMDPLPEFAEWNAVAEFNNATFEDGVLDLFNNTIAAHTEVPVTV